MNRSLARQRPFTLLVVAAALAALLLLLTACSGAKQAEGVKPGQYRLTLDFPVGQLPVGLDLVEEGGVITAYLVNGGNRTRAESTTVEGNRLTLAFPSYDSTLVAEAQPDGSLSGTATLRRKDGPVPVKFAAVPGQAWRFYETPAAATGAIGGTWLLETQGDEPEKGLLLVKETNGVLEGTIQFPTGDVRYLAGQVSGDEFALSTFDGNQGSVWRGKRFADGTLRGENFGATAKTPTKWIAHPQSAAPADQVVAIGEEKPPVERIDFTFPDANGKPVSLSDPQYKGKVVVVAIGGTWCPNCHDEALFLAPYAKRRKAEGLEVIGLQLEYTDDPARSAAQSRRFAQRYNIEYPLLIAGKSGAEGSKKALPQLDGVRVYPTTLFIDRKGRLRTIHTGYAGPATGELNKKATAEFDALVSELLAEKA
ncbi:hypothetical protein CLG96_10250 [Sphingomonas oleivorans]|uniref:Thioredoxin domain-containing protein n=1 Tax=Sphingomonas oleivorans TaxID=1735121 RepID=A0A2T5FXA8_9SPHN|nr:TlpA disulfide reductase family protein [Sphingomonas oleivorans]PTQ10777.1 hypothetical protein CLG96_10250 [Sphingomonas oleivorans]